MSKGKQNDDLVKITHEPHRLPCKLNEAQKAETADQLATATQQLESLEYERKASAGDFKSRKEALTERLHKFANQVKEGIAVNSVDCELRLNYSKLTTVLIRLDTGEIVEERAMTDEEKQMQFEFEEKMAEEAA